MLDPTQPSKTTQEYPPSTQTEANKHQNTHSNTLPQSNQLHTNEQPPLHGTVPNAIVNKQQATNIYTTIYIIHNTPDIIIVPAWLPLTHVHQKHS
eukprot:gene3446-2397_t